jgi:hypothetical protein
MAGSKGKNARGRGFRANIVVWTLLAALVLAAGVLALNVTQRFRRVVLGDEPGPLGRPGGREASGNDR